MFSIELILFQNSERRWDPGFNVDFMIGRYHPSTRAARPGDRGPVPVLTLRLQVRKEQTSCFVLGISDQCSLGFTFRPSIQAQNLIKLGQHYAERSIIRLERDRGL